MADRRRAGRRVVIPTLTIRPIDTWPEPFTRDRRRSNFASPWTATAQLMERELRVLEARTAVMLIAVGESDLRLDGGIRSTARPEHPGVIVAFESKHGPLKYVCDTFDHWQDNVRAIALGLEALRKVDRYGITKRGEQYSGWRALSGGDVMTVDAAERVVVTLAGADPDSEIWVAGSDEDRKQIIRSANFAAHPDTGGSEETWLEFQRALRTLSGVVS